MEIKVNFNSLQNALNQAILGSAEDRGIFVGGRRRNRKRRRNRNGKFQVHVQIQSSRMLRICCLFCST